MKKVLLDECVPKALQNMLTQFETRTAQQMGWDAIQNGPLLAVAESNGFTAFVTSDKNLRYQQNLGSRQIGIFELPTNRLSIVRKLGVTGRGCFEHNSARRLHQNSIAPCLITTL